MLVVLSREIAKRGPRRNWTLGRLTLNVLLPFAQFEREVTGERIRDKIAASKKRDIWMGGVVPLGYRVQDRALHIVAEHTVLVRDLFRRCLEVGTVVGLQAILDRENVRLPVRIDGKGKSTGGGLPRGFGGTRLADAPMAWSAQWAALGLAAPAAV